MQKKKSYQSTVSILETVMRKEVTCFDIRTLKENLQVIEGAFQTMRIVSATPLKHQIAL